MMDEKALRRASREAVRTARDLRARAQVNLAVSLELEAHIESRQVNAGPGALPGRCSSSAPRAQPGLAGWDPSMLFPRPGERCARCGEPDRDEHSSAWLDRVFECLGVVSRDLQSRLIGIALGASGLVHGDEPLPEDARAVLVTIRDSAEWLQKTVRDLLEVASIEAGRLKLYLRDQRPGPILAEARAACAPLARASGISLQTRVARDLPAVRADAERVLQVLSILVVSALEAAGPGGRVIVRARRDPAGVRISVEDTGPGIAAEELPHLFEGFRQARPGTGLGLALVRGIVEVHGGKIGVESTPGEGSVFSFTIPAAV
jgi:signal transduction histidine kinase